MACLRASCQALLAVYNSGARIIECQPATVSFFLLSSSSKLVLPYFFQPPPTVTMLFKSFALAAAFAAFAPALAAPVSDNVLPVRRQLADVGVVVDNVLNNGTISILSSRGEGTCSLAEVTAVVTNVLNNPKVKVASSSKRGGCDDALIKRETYKIVSRVYTNASPNLSKRGYEGCSLADVDAVLSNIANNATITVLKRDDCDLIGLGVILKNVLNNLSINVLAPSTKRDATLANVGVVVTDVLENLKVNVASPGKRGSSPLVDITALITDVANNLKVDVASP
ncbi:hypothetical protein K503DRAFT_853931 [Rhizopogon vinicolor AM-OR11-026]|uniref:Uncharacterized protein n=1 Tax=Rhizopogon vinicolor AM-OR11-026 TaxID=1314800 RepID=A0A1B7NCD3_9AGAM|nr:hypothetical protein K503DRAFT_853931 [Rhizopogon vinicolor AM-OR11-026]